jgi:hypothetical protein
MPKGRPPESKGIRSERNKKLMHKAFESIGGEAAYFKWLKEPENKTFFYQEWTKVYLKVMAGEITLSGPGTLTIKWEGGNDDNGPL